MGPKMLRTFYIAVLCALIAGDLDYGYARVRVFGIGPHVFFEWKDNQNLIKKGFLKNARVSTRLVEVEREIGIALKENPGPVFFGPRLDFNYVMFRLPSPEHWPIYWEPTTSFAPSEENKLVQNWREHKFATLIFLNIDLPGDSRTPHSIGYTFYSDELLNAIRTDYVADERFSLITVYHRR